MNRRTRRFDAPPLPKSAEAIESFSRRIELLITECRMAQSDGNKITVQREDCWIVPIAVLNGKPAESASDPSTPLTPERASLLRVLEDCLASENETPSAADKTRLERPVAAAPRPVTAPPDCRLTRREKQILEHVLAGHPNKVTAYELMISRRTVEHHRAAMMRKTGARSVPELIRLVREYQMVGS